MREIAVAPFRQTEDGQLARVTPDNLKRKERHAADKRHNPRNDYSRGESDRTILETNSDTDDAQNDQHDAAELLHQKKRAVSSVCGHDKPPAQVDVQVSPTIGADKSILPSYAPISAVRLFVVRRSDEPKNRGSDEKQGANDPALSRACDQCTEKQRTDEARPGPADTASDRENNGQRSHHCCNTLSTTAYHATTRCTTDARRCRFTKGGCSILEHYVVQKSSAVACEPERGP
jgi:hypothetical protein